VTRHDGSRDALTFAGDIYLAPPHRIKWSMESPFGGGAHPQVDA
jgi:hypothetical protein